MRIEPRTSKAALCGFENMEAIDAVSYDQTGIAILGDHILSNGDKLPFKNGSWVDAHWLGC